MIFFITFKKFLEINLRIGTLFEEGAFYRMGKFKMNYLKIYLAYQESMGVNNKKALDKLRTTHKEKNPNELILTPVDISRAKNDKINLDQKIEINKAIANVIGCEYSNLNSIFEKLKSNISVIEILSKYENRLSQKNKFDSELLYTMKGVWEQYNLSTFENEPKIRRVIKHIYERNGDLLCQSVGISTDWKGIIEKRMNVLHFSEERENVRFGEFAEYIYNIPHGASGYNEWTLIITGAVIVPVIIQDNPEDNHIFSGVTVLRKSPELTVKYGNNHSLFRGDREITKKLCFRKSFKEFNELDIKHKNNILKKLGFTDDEEKITEESNSFFIVHI